MRKLVVFLGGVCLVGVVIVSYIYWGIFQKKINIGEKESVFFYIKTSDRFQDVIHNLNEQIVHLVHSMAPDLRSFGGKYISR